VEHGHRDDVPLRRFAQQHDAPQWTVAEIERTAAFVPQDAAPQQTAPGHRLCGQVGERQGRFEVIVETYRRIDADGIKYDSQGVVARHDIGDGVPKDIHVNRRVPRAGFENVVAEHAGIRWRETVYELPERLLAARQPHG
jgi:hypothetical protein